MTTPTNQDAWERWFLDAWSDREDNHYPRLFGPLTGRLEPLPRELFALLGVADAEIDSRWLRHGVLASPPNSGRPETWLLVTTALSNPWGVDPKDADPRLPSGLGFEMLIEAPAPPAAVPEPGQAPQWAINTLHWLTAVQILAATDRLQGGTLQYGDLVPLGAPLDPARPDGVLRNLFIVPPPRGASRFQLASGTVDLLLCVGISDNEYAYAKQRDGNALLDLLTRNGAYPVTNPERQSVAPA